MNQVNSTQSILNYNTLYVSLSRQTRTCFVKVANDQKFFNTSTYLKELENLFDWLSNKVEINSVIFKFASEEIELFKKEELRFFDDKTLGNTLQLLARLSWAQILLPQTVIWSFQKSACPFSIELAMGGDIRYCAPSFSVNFDQLNKGITPMGGMNTLTNEKGNSAKIMQFLLSSQNVGADALISAGLIGKTLYSENEIEDIVSRISKQSPMARIQTKRSFNNELIKNMEEVLLEEITFANSTLATGDFKNYANDRSFTNPRDFARVLKKTPTVAEAM